MNTLKKARAWFTSAEGDRWFALVGLVLVAALVLVPSAAAVGLTIVSEYTAAAIYAVVALVICVFCKWSGFVADLWGTMIHDDLLWDDSELSRKALARKERELEAMLNDEYWSYYR